jgi:hypothetical protein
MSDGKSYPGAYSEDERAAFRGYANQARAFYDGRAKGWSERPSIDMLDDDRYLGGLPIYKGRSCSAGSKFVQIYPNGDVFRCGGLDLQGKSPRRHDRFRLRGCALQQPALLLCLRQVLADLEIPALLPPVRFGSRFLAQPASGAAIIACPGKERWRCRRPLPHERSPAPDAQP